MLAGCQLYPVLELLFLLFVESGWRGVLLMTMNTNCNIGNTVRYQKRNFWSSIGPGCSERWNLHPLRYLKLGSVRLCDWMALMISCQESPFLFFTAFSYSWVLKPHHHLTHLFVSQVPSVQAFIAASPVRVVSQHTLTKQLWKQKRSA